LRARTTYLDIFKCSSSSCFAFKTEQPFCQRTKIRREHWPGAPSRLIITSVEEERQNTRRIAASVMFYTGFSKRLSGNSRHRPRGGEYRMMPAAIYLF